MYPRLVKPLLFHLEPERAHSLTLSAVHWTGRLSPAAGLVKAFFRAPDAPLQAFGLKFINPVGLAAGYDKDGLGWRGLACLGFGHIEVGTVTLRPQAGNPKPRVFRLVEERGLINRMGFPGQGAQAVAARLAGPRPAGLVLGVNLGKNKDTPLEEASQDYLELMDIFLPLADYLAINVSSPNTVGLRRLQGRDALEKLLSALVDRRATWLASAGKHVPLLVKLSPDLDDAELDDALEVMLRLGIEGVIATNTTLSRQGIISSQASQAGGLSGAPLRERSTYVVREICRRTGGRLSVIGCGGIENAHHAREKLDAGALLVQVYTGLIYTGPGLVKEIMRSVSGKPGSASI
jgi:dihydroorotate dehydrogenase